MHGTAKLNTEQNIDAVVGPLNCIQLPVLIAHYAFILDVVSSVRYIIIFVVRARRSGFGFI